MGKTLGKTDIASVLSRYMKNLGVDWSEALCFGVAEGLVFTYSQEQERVSLENESMIHCFSENIGFDSKTYCISNIETNALKNAQYMLSNKASVPIVFWDQDIGRNRIELLTRVMPEGKVEIEDCTQNSRNEYSVEELISRGRQTVFHEKISAPVVYIIYPRSEMLPLDEILVQAIRNNADKMIGNHQLKSCIENCRNYQKVFQKLQDYEKETGLLREYYADFLQESYQITGIDEIKELETGYREVASKWKQFMEDLNHMEVLVDVLSMEENLYELALRIKTK